MANRVMNRSSRSKCAAPTAIFLKRFHSYGLGESHVDQLLTGIEEMVARLRALDYAGWVVVEQDFIPKSRDTMERAIADQDANLRFLRSLGL